MRIKGFSGLDKIDKTGHPAFWGMSSYDDRYFSPGFLVNVSPLWYYGPMIKTRRRTRDEVQRTLELRRSSIASPHKNKAKYSRKAKHRDRFVTE